MSAQVSIKLYDLGSAARSGKLTDVVGRDQELIRLVRILLRPDHHNVALVAEPGTGKTSLIEALALRLFYGEYPQLGAKIYRLAVEPILGLMVGGESIRQCTNALIQATSQLDSAIIVIEDIQLLASDDASRLELTMSLLQALSARPNISLIVTASSGSYYRIFRDDYSFSRSFDPLELPAATEEAAVAMTLEAVPRLERASGQIISDGAVEQAVRFGQRFGHGRALPDAAIRLLEETSVKVGLEGRAEVTDEDIQMVVAERERLPLRDLASDQRQKLAMLEPGLLKAVVGQDHALRAIARTVAKSQLGLGDSSRPRGSFLLLGPSGVGKTETAKALSQLVFSGQSAMVRLDMSEYQESHSAIRLIGSPPGYVGYEEGGQLTGAVAREPYSLVLLDEIEKAHPKVFDLFLQLLDDGRLTDSSGKTVDFTETLVLATSNVGAQEIAVAAASGIDVCSNRFLQQTIMPRLMQAYRPEFINRFDAVLIYQPLSLTHLVSLAQRELQQLAGRLEKLGVQFDVQDDTLRQLIAPNYNPLFGARPVKRIVATHFETPIADALIRGELDSPVKITGYEPWLVTQVTS